MNSKSVCISQVIFFFLLIAAYIFLATRKNVNKWTKIGEIVTLYGGTFFFAFSKTISTALFIITACGVILFNHLFKQKQEQNERRTETTNNQC